MTSVLPPRQCDVCDAWFTPKPRGYNARYCSSSCKTRRRPKKKISYSSEYYFKRKQDPVAHAKMRASARRSARKVRQWLANYKLIRGCVDCGYKQFACALQLDHNGPKTASISELRSSKKRILEEIERGNCVVRCANCHAVKTWKEKNMGNGQ